MSAVQAESSAKKVTLIGLVLPISQLSLGMQALIQSVIRDILFTQFIRLVDPVGLVVSVVPLTHQMTSITNWPQCSYGSICLWFHLFFSGDRVDPVSSVVCCSTQVDSDVSWYLSV